MKNVLAKFTDSGNPNVLLCERGASFGYNTLVSDMRSLPIMASLGCPVVFDATHSVQQPGGQGGSSGGQREFVRDPGACGCCASVSPACSSRPRGSRQRAFGRPEHGASEGHAEAARKAAGLRRDCQG